jgi:cytochrome c biogenesis protein
MANVTVRFARPARLWNGTFAAWPLKSWLEQEARRSRRIRIPLIGGVLRLLISVQFAVVLILVIAAIVLVGSAIDQVPPAVRANAALYAQWLEGARAKYGIEAGVLERLQLFDAFHSLFFRVLLALLATSILACTIKRSRSIWYTAFHTRVRVSESFFQHAGLRAAMDVAAPATDAADHLRRTLSTAHYRVKAEAGAGSVALLADKNLLSRFATILTHFSIILVLGAGIAGSFWGFKDPQFVVAEGAQSDLGLVKGLSVQLNHFDASYYPDGRPESYSSDITILDRGVPVKQGVVRVNSPLRFQGISFHQSFFGQAVVMKVQDSSGRVLFDQGLPLSLKTADGQRPVGRLDLPDQNTTVFFTGQSADGMDPVIQPGEVWVDVYRGYLRDAPPEILSQRNPMALGGLTFTFERETRFTGLNVVKNPGMNVLWLASALLFLGLAMTFYLPGRRVWALCKEQADGTTKVLLAMPGQNDVALSGEFQTLSERAAQALDARSLSVQKDESDDD